jgi:hypothetical protein
MADIFYTDAPIIAESPPYRVRPAGETTTHRAGAQRAARNWLIAIVYAMIHTGAMTTLVTLATGSNDLGLLSLAIHGAALLAGLAVWKLITLVTSSL